MGCGCGSCAGAGAVTARRGAGLAARVRVTASTVDGGVTICRRRGEAVPATRPCLRRSPRRTEQRLAAPPPPQHADSASETARAGCVWVQDEPARDAADCGVCGAAHRGHARGGGAAAHPAAAPRHHRALPQARLAPPGGGGEADGGGGTRTGYRGAGEGACRLRCRPYTRGGGGVHVVRRARGVGWRLLAFTAARTAAALRCMHSVRVPCALCVPWCVCVCVCVCV